MADGHDGGVALARQYAEEAMFYSFYSYSGGTGRTMALSNIAVMLYGHGLNVIAIDCDLEAPALDSYLSTDNDDGSSSREGLVELINKFKETMSKPPVEHKGTRRLNLPDIDDYLHLVDSNERGFLKLMPTGKRLGEDFKAYSETVCRFDWDDFYYNWEGKLFFQWLKQGLRQKANADVILINSPTGITEMSNVCNKQLADAVVLFCTSNRQSRAGMLKLAFNLTGVQSNPLYLKGESKEGSRGRAVGQWAEEKEESGERRPRLVIVPARIEQGEEQKSLLESFRHQFVKEFESFLPEDKKKEPEYFWNLRIPYIPAYSFAEQIAARAKGVPEAELMVGAYDRIIRAMARLATSKSKLYELCDDKAAVTIGQQGKLGGLEPYRSMLPFYEQHAPLFFGREECVRQLIVQIREGGMIAIVGQSGSGKSSLVHAGLLPKVRAGRTAGIEHWRIVILTPNTNPLEKLADELCRQQLEEGVEPLGEPKVLAKRLEHEQGSLAPVVSHVLRGLPGAARLLLVVDQFEELVTLSNVAERSAFLEQIVDAVRAGQLTVVFTMRHDFYDEFMELNKELAAAVGQRVLRLGRMEPSGLRNAVTKPAELMGLMFEPGLVDRILSDVGQEPGNLPLLQFALTKLWEDRDGMRLTHYVYTAIGGVKGAVATEAERVYMSLLEREKEIARMIFTRLVQLSENKYGPNTRRRETYAELGEGALPIIKKLADKRLLVAGGDDSGSAREDSRADQVEVAHEALIQSWPRLAEWIRDDREFLLWRQKLWRAVADWKDTNEDNDALLRGQLLRNAEEQLSQRAADLSEPMKDFIARSSAQQKRRIRERKWRSRDRLILAGAAILLILASIGSIWLSRLRTQKVFDASTYLFLGSEGELAGNYQAALENYGKAIELSPELPDPYLARATVYSRRGAEGDYEAAIKDFDKFLQLKPNSAVAYNGRGEVYYKMSRNNAQLRESALRDFASALTIDNGFAPAWYSSASVLFESGKLDDAIGAFDHAIATEPEFNKSRISIRAAPVEPSRLYDERGQAYFQRWKLNKSSDDLQQAKADFNHAIMLDTRFAEPYFHLGTLSVETVELTKAISFYTIATELKPGYGEAYNARGEALEQLNPGAFAELITNFHTAIDLGYQPAHLNLAQVYLRDGQNEKAIESFNSAIAYQPSNALAYWGRGDAYARKGEHMQALKDFSRAIELDPNLIDAYFSRGVSYDETRDTEHAIADLRKFAEEMEHPERPEKYRSKEYMQKLYDARMRLSKLGYKALPTDARVSLHYGDPSNRALANQVEAALLRAGFHKVTSSLSVSRDNMPIVKYFNRADSNNAIRVRDEVNKVYVSSGNPRYFGCWLMPPRSGRKDTFGLIEIWLPSPPMSQPPPPTTPSPAPEN